jgi:hypothetical protein
VDVAEEGNRVPRPVPGATRSSRARSTRSNRGRRPRRTPCRAVPRGGPSATSFAMRFGRGPRERGSVRSQTAVSGSRTPRGRARARSGRRADAPPAGTRPRRPDRAG